MVGCRDGEFAGVTKTGRPQVKSSSGPLALRGGWHLGELPRAKQFDRGCSWKKVQVPYGTPTEKVGTYTSFASNKAVSSNIGKIYWVKDIGTYLQVVDDDAPYFPYDFVWAYCDYVMDVEYQAQADERGYMRTNADGTEYRSNKYQHSLAGLPYLPKDGYYKYRTNPNPDTVPWIITGQMRVRELLDDFEVADILASQGIAPIHRQGGDKTLAELGLK